MISDLHNLINNCIKEYMKHMKYKKYRRLSYLLESSSIVSPMESQLFSGVELFIFKMRRRPGGLLPPVEERTFILGLRMRKRGL